MQAKIQKQAEIDRCKAVCRIFFEKRNLSVSYDEAVADDVEWAPHVYARNDEQYGVDIATKPFVEPFWLDTYRLSVKPNKPDIRVCLAFPFEIALRLSPDVLKAYVEQGLSIIAIYDDGNLDFFKHDLARVPSRTANSIIQALMRKKAKMLSDELDQCAKGHKYFSQYEKICLDIFTTLFVPPLSVPKTQSSTSTRLRRRDHLFPNYTQNGFWSDVIKHEYKGSYVLLECKNLNTPVSPREVDDIARYLNEKSIGLFGIITGRKPANREAKRAQASRWTSHNQMIITLADRDLLKMIELYENQEDPCAVIREQIDAVKLGVE
jgi:hypothetical protein